jgi:predicted HicB family RNase H-like nuclease
MSEEKVSRYRGFTEAQARAHKKYISQFVETKIRMTPERRDTLKAAADACGESVNAYINKAIDERMEREGA